MMNLQVLIPEIIMESSVDRSSARPVKPIDLQKLCASAKFFWMALGTRQYILPEGS